MTMTAEFPTLTLHDWACIRSELIWVYDRPVMPIHRVIDSIPSPGNWCWYLRRGRAKVVSKEKTYEVKAGQWINLPRNPHRHEFSRDAVILSLHFLCQWPAGEDLFANREGLVLEGKSCPELELKASRLQRLVHRHFPHEDLFYSKKVADYGLFLRFHSQFLDWMAAWYRVLIEKGWGLTRLRTGDDRSLRAARCLNEARLDEDYPRGNLLRETGLSEVHLTQLFLRDFGLTPRKYWDRRRLEEAKICLETSALSVKELSYRLAFCTDSHFVSWFQKQTGESPGHYRLRTKAFRRS